MNHPSNAVVGAESPLCHAFITCPNTMPGEESLAGEPECVAMYRSGVDSSKVGAFMAQDLPKNVCFGPLLMEDEGAEKQGECAHSWTSSRWMHFVLCAPPHEDHNLVPITYKGRLYYKTCKDLKADEELLLANQPHNTISMNPVFDVKKSSSVEDVRIIDNGDEESNSSNVWKDAFPESTYHHTADAVENPCLNPDDDNDCLDSDPCVSSADKQSGCDLEHTPIKIPCLVVREVVDVKEELMQVNDIDNGKGLLEKTTTESQKSPILTPEIEQQNDPLPHRCNMCEMAFKDVRSLRYHKRRHSSPFPVKKRQLKVALRAKRSVCRTCGEQFSSLKKSKAHQCSNAEATDERFYLCEACGKTFTSLANFQAHSHSQPDIKNAPYACDLCGKRFALLAALQAHNHDRSGNNDHPFECRKCRRKFKTQPRLSAHDYQVHLKKQPHECSICGKVFDSVFQLQVHLRTHSGNRPFGCKTCGKTFPHKTNLEMHSRVHSGEKPFLCNTCGKKFSQLTNLKAHNRVHSGEKPFLCKTCGKKFSQLANLQAHNRVHTGEKPFLCKTCGKTFAQLGNLQSHNRKHTGENPYACHICDHRCHQLSSLKAHLKSHN